MTQKQRVLDYVERFGSISSMEAFRDLGITRLSAVIFDLREAGHRFDTATEQAQNRFGERTRYARYFPSGDGRGDCHGAGAES